MASQSCWQLRRRWRLPQLLSQYTLTESIAHSTIAGSRFLRFTTMPHPVLYMAFICVLLAWFLYPCSATIAVRTCNVLLTVHDGKWRVSLKCHPILNSLRLPTTMQHWLHVGCTTQIQSAGQPKQLTSDHHHLTPRLSALGKLNCNDCVEHACIAVSTGCSVALTH